MNILLTARDIKLTAAFYAALGESVMPEKHGAGPDHFSFAPTDAEIYPPRKSDAPDKGLVVRIETQEKLEDVLIRVGAVYRDALIYQRPADMKSGRKTIISDPDGRIVEIFQTIKAPAP